MDGTKARWMTEKDRVLIAWLVTEMDISWYNTTIEKGYRLMITIRAVKHTRDELTDNGEDRTWKLRN